MSITKVTKPIRIEMSGVTRRYEVTAKQGDMATRFVEVTLLNNSEEYMIPEGSLVRAYIKKPDGKVVYNSCTFAGAKVTVELDNQTLAAAGTALCEIKVHAADLTQRITSVTFEIEIEPQVMDENAVMSSNEMGVLDGLMKQYAEAEDAREKAEAARAEVENARKQAESDRVTAEAARAEVENDRKQAENDRVTAENARAEAEKKRASAETTRGEKETEREKAEEERAKEESSRETAERERVTAEETRKQMAQEVLDKANKAILIASKINQASYIEDRDTDMRYAYSIYVADGVPHMALTQIEKII